MRPLPVPPPWRPRLNQALPLHGEANIRAFLNDMSREYLHWEKLRYRPMPEGLVPEDAWALVKFSRSMLPRKALPLRDERDRPFTYVLPAYVVEVLHEVDRGGGTTLLTDAPQSELQLSRDQILVTSLMEEAIATSQIEGAVTTRKVAKELLRTNRPPRNRSEQMIVNSYRTIQMLRAERDQPLSIPFLLRIQEMMTADTLDDETAAGRLRTAADDINIIDIRDGEIVFTPPAAALLPDRLKRLVGFANSKHTGPDFLHPLVKAAVLHFWLAYEHPFVDGNGRTARALFYWHMLRSGYWLFEFLTISRVILASPKAYYRSFLYTEQDDNDLTYSILFQIEATRKALVGLHEYLARKRKEQELFSSILRVPNLNPRQRAVLREGMQEPDSRFTFESHSRTHNITHLTARKDLIELFQRGFLQRTKDGRRLVFLPVADLAERVGRDGRRRR